MNNHLDFIIIGAMKCATTTLHEQLAAQPGIFMSEPKEPNFFSNDSHYKQGINGYWTLFDSASAADLCGESSTHYTKLPTYPNTIERIQKHLPDVKVIYIMRHPIDRLVSQYIHEWTQKNVSVDINRALTKHPELIQYSQYSMQLRPYIDTFGPDRVLPIFVEKLRSQPQQELERVCRFIGYTATPTWQNQLNQQHVSSDRIRESVWRDFLVDNPVLSKIRQQFVPKAVRTWVRGWWQMKKRPEIEPAQMEHLQVIFDQDLAVLGSWLGMELTCRNFKSVVLTSPETWQGLSQQDTVQIIKKTAS